jgi:hypothetical protein
MNKRISKIFTLVVLSGALLLLTARCSKLTEKPKDFVGPDNFYNTPAQVEAAFSSMMNRLWGGWTFYDWYRAPQIFDMDDQVYGGNLVIGDGLGNDCWSKHYQAIGDLTPAIKAMANDQLGSSVTQEVKDQLMAQAKFLRAWNYFFLVRYYGDVPIITETTDVVADKIVRAPVADVYNFIVSDLLFATQHLPVAWGEDKKAVPTMDVAKALLAKVYITMATAHNYSLIPDVADVFKLENGNGPEMMWSFHNSAEEYVIEPQIWLPGDMAGGWGDVKTEKRWGEAYPEEPRKHSYLLLSDVIFGGGTNYLQWDGSAPYVRKYLYDLPSNLEKDVNYESMPILRFADVLLLFAEAENQVNGGPNQAAVDAVNQIVTRATGGVPNAADPLADVSMSKDAFDSFVIQQRNYELCFEYDRWFDIQRKRILDKVCDPQYLQNFSQDDYLLAIPQKDLRLNKDLVQNPGYTDPNR